MGVQGCAGAPSDAGRGRLSPAWLLGLNSTQRKAQILYISLQGFRGQSSQVTPGPTGQALGLWLLTHWFIWEMPIEAPPSQTLCWHVGRKWEFEQWSESWPSFTQKERRRRNATDHGRGDGGGRS